MWQSNQLPGVYDWFFFLGRFSAMTLPLLTVRSFRCHQRGCGDACCVAAGASWSCEGPISSYEWNIVVNFVRRWNKWQFRYVVTIFVPAEWRTWPCSSMDPHRCLRRSPPWACVHPAKCLLRYAVLESDGTHRCLLCSCSETRAIKHSCGSSAKILTTI
jgi:hypothetical protein